MVISPHCFSNVVSSHFHRVFDPRVSPEPAYPSLVPSIAETAYFEEEKNGDVAEDTAVLHAPPGYVVPHGE